MLNLLVVQFENAIEDTDFVVAKGFLALTMEGEERFEVGLFVCVGFAVTENPVKELRNGPRDRGSS